MVTLDFSTDFADVVDNLASVTFKGLGAVAPITVADAHKQTVGRREAEASGGMYTTSDVVWYLQKSTLDANKMVGGQIVSGSEIYTVLDASYSAVEALWRCVARLLKVLSAKVRIQVAERSKGTHGDQEPTWTDLYPSEAAHIEEVDRQIVDDGGQRLTVTTHQIYLENDRDLTKDHRIVDADGTIYKFKEYQKATLDSLAVFTGAVNPFQRAG